MNERATQVQTALAPISVSDIEKMAMAVAKSGLFGVKTPDQAMALMLIAQAEGMHPAIAARDYHIIDGKPSLKADAMLARFIASGGKVQWHEHTDTCVAATFSHPAGGSVRIDWDMARAKTAGIDQKQNWKKYPRQMLRARVISEGVRAVNPNANSGMYTPEEVMDFSQERNMGDAERIEEVSAAMDPATKADYEAAIEALVDRSGAENLWKEIAATCKAVKDTIAYNELKARITKKGETLK